MKGVLEFTLPEEQEEFKLAQDAWKYSIIIDEMFNWLRSLEKHQNVKKLTVEQVRTKLVELRSERFE